MRVQIVAPLALALALAILPRSPLAAQQAAEPQAPPLPATPMGTVAGRFLDAVNAGDAEIRAFVAAHAAERLSGDATPDGYASVWSRLREQSGGLELVTPLPGGDPAVMMLVRSRVGDRYLGIEVAPAAEQPDRFAHLAIHPFLSDPRKGSGLWVPAGEADDAARTAHVERSVATLVERDEFSGVVLVARGDEVLFERAYGKADAERGVPNTLRTRFHVGSIDKMFTAVAIAQLVERGALRFEDTLATVLPDYPNAEAARKITIAQLLTHTAGVGDPFESPRYDPRRQPSGPQSAWFPLFADQPPAFEPGARHQYSNGGYLVLGAVIEELTGRSYHDHVREHVFLPAGMTDTEPDARGAIPNAAQRYYRDPVRDPLSVDERIPKLDGFDPGVGVAMGGSYLTARDLFRFARALRQARLLSPGMTGTVVSGKVPVAPGGQGGPRYAYGFYDVSMGTPVRGHSGGGSGSGIDADVEILWDLDYSVVVVGNYDTPAARAVAQGIVRLLAAGSGQTAGR